MNDTESQARVVVVTRTFGEIVDLATDQIVLYGADDPNVRRALRRLARSLELLELGEADRTRVEGFAARLDGE